MLREFLEDFGPKKKTSKNSVPGSPPSHAQLAVGQLQDEGAHLGLAVLRGGREPRERLERMGQHG